MPKGGSTRKPSPVKRLSPRLALPLNLAPAEAVVSRGVRRVWVTLLVGLFGLTLGLTIGFAVGLWKRTSDPAWLEAVGTWVGAGVTMLAVILAVIVFFSEDFARRREDRRQSEAADREHRRQLEAAEDARQVERAKLQQQADLVACAARYSTSTGIGKPGLTQVKQIEVSVANNSSHVIRNVFCHVPQMDDEPRKLWDVLSPGQPARQVIDVHNPFTTHEDHRDLYASAMFTFSLGGVDWSAKYAQPAERQETTV
jgi:hypothetical protein